MTAVIRTSERDQNYLSFNRDSIVWFAGTDEEREETDPIPQPLNLLPEKPKKWDSILKFSNRKDTRLLDIWVDQGKENAVDINNESSGLILQGNFGTKQSEGEQVITIKGGSHNITMFGKVHSQGTDADLEVGCWSDESYDVSHNLNLSGLSRDSDDYRPITVVFGRVNNPIMAALGKPKDIQLPKGAKVLFWASIGEIIYWHLKYAAVKLGLIGRKA